MWHISIHVTYRYNNHFHASSYEVSWWAGALRCARPQAWMNCCSSSRADKERCNAVMPSWDPSRRIACMAERFFGQVQLWPDSLLQLWWEKIWERFWEKILERIWKDFGKILEHLEWFWKPGFILGRSLGSLILGGDHLVVQSGHVDFFARFGWYKQQVKGHFQMFTCWTFSRMGDPRRSLKVQL